MNFPRFGPTLRTSLLVVLQLFSANLIHAQGARITAGEAAIGDADADHERERAEWFARGRVISGKSSAELRHRAYQAKMQSRAAHHAMVRGIQDDPEPAPLTGGWTPLGPVPLASDASGLGVQDYHQVSGRATAVAIDPADATGNTIYIGGAQGGVWKSINAAASTVNNVTWIALTDEQATSRLAQSRFSREIPMQQPA